MLGLSDQQPPSKPAFSIPSVPVYWSVLTVGLIIVATVAFWRASKEDREALNFLVLASAVGAGSLSAYYVWCGLKTSVAQRNEILREERVERAMSYSIRWNDGANASIRKKWLEILTELEATPPLTPVALFADMDKRSVVADVLNFWEEMAYGVKTGAVDKDTIQHLFGGLSQRYMRAVRPWIEFRRVGGTTTHPRAWCNFEWLCDQWK